MVHRSLAWTAAAKSVHRKMRGLRYTPSVHRILERKRRDETSLIRTRIFEIRIIPLNPLKPSNYFVWSQRNLGTGCWAHNNLHQLRR